MSYQTMCENMDAEKLGPEAVKELKETRFIEGLVLGKTQTMAAIDAGYTGRDVRTPGKIIPPEELRLRFQDVARRKGLTLDRIGDNYLSDGNSRLIRARIAAWKAHQTPSDLIAVLLRKYASSNFVIQS